MTDSDGLAGRDRPPEATPDPQRCQWCGESAPVGTTHCPACGAAMPLVVPIDELRVAGVTELDPELKAYEKGHLRIPAGSPTQAMAGRMLGAAALGGVGGVLAAGALAAVAAHEYNSSGHSGGHASALDVGQPSESAIEIARRLQEAQLKKNLLPPPPPPPPVVKTGE